MRSFQKILTDFMISAGVFDHNTKYGRNARLLSIFSEWFKACCSNENVSIRIADRSLKKIMTEAISMKKIMTEAYFLPRYSGCL